MGVLRGGPCGLTAWVAGFGGIGASRTFGYQGTKERDPY